MTRLRRLCILTITAIALLPALPANAQTPAANEIPPIDEFEGIEAAVDRTWGLDIEGMLAATPDLQPEDFDEGVTVLSVMVLRFDTDEHAGTGYDAFQRGIGSQLLEMGQGGTPTVSDEPISDLGDVASAVTLTTTTPEQETYLRFVLVREGQYVFLTYALATTSDEATIADGLTQYVVNEGAEQGDEAIYVAEGASTGGLWGFMPPDDHELLGELVPIADETLYPAP
ncbi:MAG: hypothetical protein M3457_22845 [Chloroflexota bacterium]|nr:hypothetical protein [Chloroflexota bacterium]